MMTGRWFLLCGKLAAVMSVSPTTTTVAFVPAGSCFSRPRCRFHVEAITLPSNVVVKTRSFETVAAP